MSIELTQAETNSASIVPMPATEIKPRPLSYSLNDYHHAGVPGSVLHAQWQDKPHRLLYDLIAAVAYYAGKQPAPQADVTDSMIREAFLTNGFTIKDGHSDLKPYVYAAARAVLALRPAAVPMTEDQVWHNDALMSANGIAGFKMDSLMRIVRAVEAHHGITAQPRRRMRDAGIVD